MRPGERGAVGLWKTGLSLHIGDLVVCRTRAAPFRRSPSTLTRRRSSLTRSRNITRWNSNGLRVSDASRLARPYPPAPAVSSRLSSTGPSNVRNAASRVPSLLTPTTSVRDSSWSVTLSTTSQASCWTSAATPATYNSAETAPALNAASRLSARTRASLAGRVLAPSISARQPASSPHSPVRNLRFRLWQ